MEKKAHFKKNSMKGAKLFELYKTILSNPGMGENLDQYWPYQLNEKLESVKLSREEQRTEGIEFHGKKLAYKKITDYLEYDLEIKKYSEREFKAKIFRGTKVNNLIDFLEREIIYCENACGLFDRLELVEKELILLAYKSQQVVYSQVLKMVIEGFINEGIKRDDFLGIWLKQNSDFY